MIIYRLTDRIPIKMGKVTFWVSPLSFQAKLEMDSHTKMVGGLESVDQVKRSYTCIKHSLKEVTGLKNADGSEYVLSFDPSGILTDECASEIMQVDANASLQIACLKLAVSTEAHKVEGVKIEMGEIKAGKKKEA